ncbi:hypothetical protein HMPREF0262_00398 [Clostridium sp. ATCC 29733]|nr:hypothetical protein HMPREF0262_00398 [Clostridium sp. ATCC 29733]
MCSPCRKCTFPLSTVLRNGVICLASFIEYCQNELCRAFDGKEHPAEKLKDSPFIVLDKGEKRDAFSTYRTKNVEILSRKK